MPTRWRDAVAAAVMGGAATMLPLSAPLPASATAPPAPPEAVAVATSFTSSAPVAISAAGMPTISSTVNVVGAGAVLFDVDVTTAISHAHPMELDVSLMSPAGTVVTLTTDNGGSGNANVFNGTTWDDDADPGDGANSVLTHAYAPNVVATPLTPEEPLAAFLGENPNGTWTLTVHDDTVEDGGQLNSWSLALHARGLPPAQVSATYPQPAVTTISDGAPSTQASPVTVSGAGTYTCDVDVVTSINHSFPGDLDLTLKSPAGTIVTLTNPRALDVARAYDGTRWDDDANPSGQVPYTFNQGLASDHQFAAAANAATLAPEEALGAFNGENPNGTWTLTVADTAAKDGGSMTWSLVVTTCPFAGVLHGVTPARLMDTRADGATVDGLSAGAGAVAGGASVDLRVTGRGGVPAGVAAVALNVTMTESSDPAFLTVYPAGGERPTASNLNVAAGQTVPNMVIVGVGSGGQISLYHNAARAHLIVDVLGWFPSTTALHSVAPARLLETRTGLTTVDAQFNGGGAVADGQIIDLQVAGRGGVPASGAAAVALNVTATEATLATYVTAFPTGAGRPTASNLNVAARQTVANMVIVPLGDGGRVSLYNNAGSTHLVVDVLGWFAVGPTVNALTPARLLDTREGASGQVGPGQALDLTVGGRGGVPGTGVAAVALNVTAVDPSAATYITVFPAGADRPQSSNLNVVPGQTAPNMVIVPVGSGGKVTLYNNAGAVGLVVDVLAWFPVPS